jgi:hypothetical protein
VELARFAPPHLVLVSQAQHEVALARERVRAQEAVAQGVAAQEEGEAGGGGRVGRAVVRQVAARLPRRQAEGDADRPPAGAQGEVEALGLGGVDALQASPRELLAPLPRQGGEQHRVHVRPPTAR